MSNDEKHDKKYESSVSGKSTTDQEIQYEKTKEYLAK